jgi:hypothetical protein
VPEREKSGGDKVQAGHRPAPGLHDQRNLPRSWLVFCDVCRRIGDTTLVAVFEPHVSRVGRKSPGARPASFVLLLLKRIATGVKYAVASRLATNHHACGV